MKVSEEYKLYKEWCEGKNRPVRSYSNFMHFKEFSRDVLVNKNNDIANVMPRLSTDKMTVEGWQNINKVSRILADKFLTHPEKVMDISDRIINALNSNEA